MPTRKDILNFDMSYIDSYVFWPAELESEVEIAEWLIVLLLSPIFPVRTAILGGKLRLEFDSMNCK